MAAGSLHQGCGWRLVIPSSTSKTLASLPITSESLLHIIRRTTRAIIESSGLVLLVVDAVVVDEEEKEEDEEDEDGEGRHPQLYIAISTRLRIVNTWTMQCSYQFKDLQEICGRFDCHLVVVSTKTGTSKNPHANIP